MISFSSDESAQTLPGQTRNALNPGFESLLEQWKIFFSFDLSLNSSANKTGQNSFCMEKEKMR